MQSIFMPTMAVAFAIGPIVGQNFGAGKPERVREACYKGIMLNSIVMLVVTLVMQIAPDVLIKGFTSEAEVIAVGSGFLQIISLNFIMQGVVFTCSGVFQGLGNTKPALFSTFVRLMIFVPVAFLLSRREGFEINQIWYVSVVSVFIQGILSFLLVERELKIKVKGMTRPERDAIQQV
jgi:Na+-driven multidrug efflux pump